MAETPSIHNLWNFASSRNNNS